MPVCLDERVAPFRRARRVDRRGERPAIVSGGVPVIRQLGRGRWRTRGRSTGIPVGQTRLERRREPGVQSGALAGEELVVDELAQEGVGEDVMRIVVPAGRHEDPTVDHLPQRRPNDRRRQSGDRLEERVVDPRTGGRGDTEDLLPRVGDRGQPRQDDVPEPGRHGPLVGLARGGEHLFREEWIAVGPLPDAVDEVGIRGWPGLLREQQREVVPPESRQVDPVDTFVALELREEDAR